MEKIRKRLILPLASALVLTLSASAQELNESVSIEGRYAPEIIKIDRVHTFPLPVNPTLDTRPPAYSLQGVTTDFRPTLFPLPATAWRQQRTSKGNSGYVDLNLGSRLNADLSAGYKIIDRQKTSLNIYLQHNSTSLWKPDAANHPDIHRFRYDETLGLRLRQDIASAGTLQADLNYHLRYFNYYSAPLSADNTASQTVNDMAVRLGWYSPNREGQADYNFNFGWRSFNYRDFRLSPDIRFRGDRENHFAIDGHVQTANPDQAFRIDMSLNMLTYDKSNFYDSDILSGLRTNTNPVVSDALFMSPKNYGIITLAPSWVLNRRNFHFNLGFSADLAFHAPGTTPETHYSFFHIAPLLNAEWTTKGFGIYARATGGTQLNTLSAAADRNYYALPLMQSQQPTHTIVDARLGLNFGPYAGFTARLEGGFALQQHTPLGGWYTLMLKNSSDPTASFFAGPGFTYGAYNPGINLHGFNATAHIRYNPLQYVDLEATYIFTPQKKYNGIFNGYDRPQHCLSASLASRPIERLHLAVEYELRAKRAIYGADILPLPENVTEQTPFHALSKKTLRNISNLNFRASFDITSRFALSFTAVNMLNRQADPLPALSDEGMQFYGGLSLKF